MSRRARAAATALLLAAAPVACGEGADGAGEPEAGGAAASAEAAPEGSPAAGGTAVVAGRGPVPTLNPLATSDFLASQLEKHVLFTTLVRYDSGFRVRPYLAESWEVDDDSAGIVFRLRDDLTWHDGVPVTAEDVAFTFRTVKDPDVAFPNRSWFDHWEGAEVVGPHAIRFALRPHAEPLHGWTQLPIVPRHLLEGTAPSELAAHPFGTERPVGSGPFRFVERAGAERWVFEANPDFPEALGGRPWLDRLVYRTVPEATTLLAELRSGAVDLVVDLQPGQVDRVRGAPGARVVTYPSRTFLFIAWNSQRPFFAEAGVRRALTMAIDRGTILRSVREGLGTVATGPVGPGHWAYDTAWAPLPYAPDSARALLEAAGWSDADGDGVRERDGRELRFELATNENSLREDVAVIVQAQLAEVGVAAEPRIREAASLGAAVTSPERRYDAAILGFDQDFVIDDRDLWSCDRVGQPFQFTSYCDPRLDPVMDSIPLATQRERRRGLIRRFHEMLAAGQPVTWLFFEEVAAGVTDELRGVRPDSRGELAGVQDWWIGPEAAAAAP